MTATIEQINLITEILQDSSDKITRLLGHQVRVVISDQGVVSGITIEEIILACAARYGTNKRDMLSASRENSDKMARMIAARIMKEIFPNISLGEIGWYLGKRDHTTVINSLKNFEAWSLNDSSLVAAYEGVLQSLRIMKNEQ